MGCFKQEERVPIPGTERIIWPSSRKVAPLSTDGDILLTAWLSQRGDSGFGLQQALQLGQTPPLARRYIDRKTLARQTAADPADIEVVRAYCQRFGLEVVDARWRSVTISGPIDAAIAAFGATVALFEDQNQRRFRHRSNGLHAVREVVSAVRGVFGLHQWPRSHKLGALQRNVQPLLARDVATRYQFPDSDAGGQTIGIVQMRGVFTPSDFDQSMTAQGVGATRPIVKRVDHAAVAHEIATTKDLEAALDAQIIGSLAPGARIVVYEAPDDERGFLDAIAEAVFDVEYAPSVLSVSYGWPEQLWTPVALDILNDLFTAAALVGMTVFCSSGDNGAELDSDGKPHVVAPASSPFAVACGATIVESPSGEERAWERTGGGFSAHFDAPLWQDAAASCAVNYGVRASRGVPDVTAQQLPGYYVVMDGIELAMGGTSAVSPMWSALAARINQRLGVPIGLFLPILYKYSGAGAVRQVTQGSNGTFNAAIGWNPCTGLGTPVGIALEKLLRETS